jgi:hypothetical protein
MVRNEYCADPSFAALLEARRLGTAMAAMIPMTATVISSSINEKPALGRAAVVGVNLGLLLFPIISLPQSCQRLEKSRTGVHLLVTSTMPVEVET